MIHNFFPVNSIWVVPLLVTAAVIFEIETCQRLGIGAHVLAPCLAAAALHVPSSAVGAHYSYERPYQVRRRTGRTWPQYRHITPCSIRPRR